MPMVAWYGTVHRSRSGLVPGRDAYRSVAALRHGVAPPGQALDVERADPALLLQPGKDRRSLSTTPSVARSARISARAGARPSNRHLPRFGPALLTRAAADLSMSWPSGPSSSSPRFPPQLSDLAIYGTTSGAPRLPATTTPAGPCWVGGASNPCLVLRPGGGRQFADQKYLDGWPGVPGVGCSGTWEWIWRPDFMQYEIDIKAIRQRSTAEPLVSITSRGFKL